MEGSPGTCNQCGKEIDAQLGVERTCESCLLLDSRPQPSVRNMPGVLAVQDALPRRFTILGAAGHGGSSIVYQAADTELDRFVAIKVIPTVTGALEASLRSSREITVMARLKHENIVVLHDIGRSDKFTYLIMEWISGGSLATLLHHGEFRVKRAVRVVCEICSVLRFIHGSKLLHRDIKPSNILLDRNSKAKLTDFGLAKCIPSGAGDDVTITATGEILGTPQYAAPEQSKPGAVVDSRTDLYSLGLVLYEMTTCARPTRLLELPSSYDKELESLDPIIRRALAEDPNDRFQSAEEFAHSLKEATGFASNGG